MRGKPMPLPRRERNDAPGRKTSRGESAERPKGSTKTRKRFKRKQVRKQAERMAQSVRYAISQRGIAPRGYYARASQKFGDNWQRGVTRMLNKVTR